jgi:hypothetical protein
MRATSVAATHPMLTRHTSPGGAAVPHAGADRPRGGRRKSVPSSSTGGSRHRQSLCRPSGPGTRCDETWLQLPTSCLPNKPAPKGRQYLMPEPTGPGVGEKRLHPLLHEATNRISPSPWEGREERAGRARSCLVPVLRAWIALRATSIAATHLMFTRHTSPGGAAVHHAGADRPRGRR